MDELEAPDEGVTIHMHFHEGSPLFRRKKKDTIVVGVSVGRGDKGEDAERALLEGVSANAYMWTPAWIARGTMWVRG